LKSKVYNSLKEIISLANKTNELSLCLFKPNKFLHIYFEAKEKEDFTEKEIIEYKNANASLFEHNSSCEIEFNIMPQLPYSIKMVFEDINGKKSKMNILDWEISQLFWTLQNKKKNDTEMKQGIKDKLNWMLEDRDLYLCLGTMKQMHGWTDNPFTIIGLFYPPKDMGYALSLF